VILEFVVSALFFVTVLTVLSVVSINTIFC